MKKFLEFLMSLFSNKKKKISALPLPKDQSEIFLNKTLGLWMHTALSQLVNDSVFFEMIRVKKRENTNVWWMYFFNENDYGRIAVSFYTGKFGASPVNPDVVKWMRGRMETSIKNGFAVVAWLTADDSPSVNRSSAVEKCTHARNVVQLFGDLISGYCVGLELEETTPVSHAAAVVAELRAHTNKSIGVHEVTGQTAYAKIGGVDTMYYQYGFNKSVSQIASETHSAKARVPGIVFIAAEYHLDSTSLDAKGLGQAALTAGAQGTGCGR